MIFLYKIFDPQNPWKEKTLSNYWVRPLQEQIFKNGELVYTLPTLSQICEKSKKELTKQEKKNESLQMQGETQVQYGVSQDV